MEILLLATTWNICPCRLEDVISACLERDLLSVLPGPNSFDNCVAAGGSSDDLPFVISRDDIEFRDV